jgi:23S rRNA (guanosine2251-2'-O)-methyltransferase
MAPTRNILLIRFLPFASIMLAISTAPLTLGFLPSRAITSARRNIKDQILPAEASTSREEERKKKDHERTSLSYTSKSTAAPDAASEFFEESEERRERLHRALQEIGFPTESFLESPEFRGSAALRTYNSFILPKSKGALAMTNQPQRAAVVANNISFLMREHRSHQEEWLRNHDRSVQEAAELNKNNMQRRPKIAIVLDDVRSAHNVGNILRAAEASSCEQVVLGGSMTPSPPHPKVLKTALGAAEYVRYQTAISTLQAVRNLKADGYRIFGIETTSKSNLLWQVSFFPDQTDALSDEKEETLGKVALIFGNELVGVDIQVLEECDELVSVPTHGIKNSLNVATCVSIIIWEALRQWEFIETKTKEL